MGLYDTVQNFVQNMVWGGIDDDKRAKMIERKRDYRNGRQAQQLEVKHGRIRHTEIVNMDTDTIIAEDRKLGNGLIKRIQGSALGYLDIEHTLF